MIAPDVDVGHCQIADAIGEPALERGAPVVDVTGVDHDVDLELRGDLVDEIDSLFAALPNTRLMARVSLMSLTAVAVPCALI